MSYSGDLESTVSNSSTQFLTDPKKYDNTFIRKYTFKKCLRLRDWLTILNVLMTTVLVCLFGMFILSLRNKPIETIQPSASKLQQSEIDAFNQFTKEISTKLQVLQSTINNSQRDIPITKLEEMIKDLNRQILERSDQLKTSLVNKPTVNKSDYINQGQCNCEDKKSRDLCHLEDWGSTFDLHGDNTAHYLAFRATAGTGHSVYQTFIGQQKQNLEKACRQMNSTLPCSGHYRNDVILDTWQNIETVVVALYKDNQLVQSVKFRAAGSNSTSWFSLNRVTDAGLWNIDTKSDLTASIVGSKDKKRPFLIGKEDRRCTLDGGLLTVLDPQDSSDACRWEDEVRQSPSPVFLYSKGSHSYSWMKRTDNACKYDNNCQIGQADVMAIFVKPFDDCHV